MLGIEEYAKIFVSLVAVANPLGVIPMFISMTSDQTPAQRRLTIRQVALAVAVILLAALVGGKWLLLFFGISVDSFRVGGGVLILLMAIAMLHAKNSPIRQTDAEADESIEKESVAVVPLAMPLLAGPGAISTVILAAQRGHGVEHHLGVAVGIVALSLLIWITLRVSPWLTDRMSATGLNVVTRVMGLILAAIAVEFIATGLKGIFPVLA